MNTVNSFKGLDFRQQIIYKNKLVTIINDSKSTSFSSSINLLKSYNNIYWILGGIAKKGDKFNLNSKYCKNIKSYIFGKDKNFFIKKLNGKIFTKSYSRANEYDKFSVLNNRTPIKTYYAVVVPDYVTVEYDFIILGSYYF